MSPSFLYNHPSLQYFPSYHFLFDILPQQGFPTDTTFEQLVTRTDLFPIHKPSKTILNIKTSTSMAQSRQSSSPSEPVEDSSTAPAAPEIGKDGEKGGWELGQTKLRRWLTDPEKTIVCPGVYDGLTAQIALSQGSECLFLCNAATTVARSALTDPALSLESVLQLAYIIRKIDKVVPLMPRSTTLFKLKLSKQPWLCCITLRYRPWSLMTIS